MQIGFRNAITGGKKISAKSYIQDGLVAMWDGIENAGWGTHVDELPVKYGMANLCNLATPIIRYDGVDYDFGLNVVGMTVERDGLAWSDATAWAAWGYTFNQSQVPLSVYENAVRTILPYEDGGTQYMTAEVVSVCDKGETAVMSNLFSGYNQRAIYASYATTGRMCVRWQEGTGGTERYDYIQTPFAGGHQSVAITQSATGGTAYINGAQVFARQGQFGYWFRSMVGFLRANNVQHNFVPSGKLNAIRVYSRALTPDEIAHNYAIDKERFNLP